MNNVSIHSTANITDTTIRYSMVKEVTYLRSADSKSEKDRERDREREREFDDVNGAFTLEHHQSVDP